MVLPLPSRVLVVYGKIVVVPIQNIQAVIELGANLTPSVSRASQEAIAEAESITAASDATFEAAQAEIRDFQSQAAEAAASVGVLQRELAEAAAEGQRLRIEGASPEVLASNKLLQADIQRQIKLRRLDATEAARGGKEVARAATIARDEERERAQSLVSNAKEMQDAAQETGSLWKEAGVQIGAAITGAGLAISLALRDALNDQTDLATQTYDAAIRADVDVTEIDTLTAAFADVGLGFDVGSASEVLSTLERQVSEIVFDPGSAISQEALRIDADYYQTIVEAETSLDRVRQTIVAAQEAVDEGKVTSLAHAFDILGAANLTPLVNAAGGVEEALSAIERASSSAFVQSRDDVNRYEQSIRDLNEVQGDLEAAIAGGVAPVMENLNTRLLIPLIGRTARLVSENDALAGSTFVLTTILGGVVGPVTTLLTLLPGLNTIIPITTLVKTGWAAATTALGAALTFLTGPIGLIILGIAGLVAAGYLLYRNWDTVTRFVSKAWDTIRERVGEFWDRWGGWISAGLAIVAPFIGIPLLLIRNWDRVRLVVLGAVETVIEGVRTAIEAANAIPLVPDIDTSGIDRVLADVRGAQDTIRTQAEVVPMEAIAVESQPSPVQTAQVVPIEAHGPALPPEDRITPAQAMEVTNNTTSNSSVREIRNRFNITIEGGADVDQDQLTKLRRRIQSEIAGAAA